MNITHRFFLFIQDLYISFNSFASPEIIHNTEKHNALKKALFYKEIEGINGDYLEFGVYEGTSIKGAASYWKKIGSSKMRFFGFDSFKGMDPKKGDEHPFYTKFDFSTDYHIIRKRMKNFPEIKLVPGFFNESLKEGASKYGINKTSIVMVDCDLYSSAKESFKFIAPLMQKGTILILDDYFNYLAQRDKGVRAAFSEFLKANKLDAEQIFTYGIGGAVFVITRVGK